MIRLYVPFPSCINTGCRLPSTVVAGFKEECQYLEGVFSLALLLEFVTIFSGTLMVSVFLWRLLLCSKRDTLAMLVDILFFLTFNAEGQILLKRYLRQICCLGLPPNQGKLHM